MECVRVGCPCALGKDAAPGVDKGLEKGFNTHRTVK